MEWAMQHSGSRAPPVPGSSRHITLNENGKNTYLVPGIGNYSKKHSARENVYTSDRVVPRVSLPSLLAGDLDQHYPQFRHLFAVTPSTAAGESDQVRLAMVACFQQRKWQYYRIVGTRTRFRHENVPGSCSAFTHQLPMFSLRVEGCRRGCRDTRGIGGWKFSRNH